MDKILYMKLMDYYVLSEFRKDNMKENKNSIKAIFIRKKLREIKKSIVNMIDNNTLTFNEFYKLLKLLEKKSSEKIYIQISKFYYEDDEFEDYVTMEGIRIIKGNIKTIDILFNNSLFYHESNSMVKCDNITLEGLLSLPNIPKILLEMNVLCEDLYDKLINLIIAYLIEREFK